MNELVTRDEHEALKKRVYLEADKLQGVTLEQAKLVGRVDSSEQSIERLRQASATSEQLTRAETILTLKLDHLLERQFEMRRQVSTSTRLAFLLFMGGVVALLYVAYA